MPVTPAYSYPCGECDGKGYVILNRTRVACKNAHCDFGTVHGDAEWRPNAAEVVEHYEKFTQHPRVRRFLQEP